MGEGVGGSRSKKVGLWQDCKRGAFFLSNPQNELERGRCSMGACIQVIRKDAKTLRTTELQLSSIYWEAA